LSASERFDMYAQSMKSVVTTRTATAIHFSSPARRTPAQIASALATARKTILSAKPIGPEKTATTREGNARIDCATEARWGGGSARTAVVLKRAPLRRETTRAPVAGRPRRV
jgi:hypothetical protein